MMKKLIFLLPLAMFTFSSCTTKNGEYYYEQATLQINDGNFEKGLNLAQKAEQLFQKDEFQWKELVVLQGEVCLWQNKTQEAVQQFTKAFETFPEDDDNLLNIVATCIRTNHTEIAQSFMENAILSEKYSSISMGLLYYYLAELKFGIDYQECRDLIMMAKIQFLKAGISDYDKKTDAFLKRLEEKETD